MKIVDARHVQVGSTPPINVVILFGFFADSLNELVGEPDQLLLVHS
jgi:hypothetical protein